jgi:hypothetical protein
MILHSAPVKRVKTPAGNTFAITGTGFGTKASLEPLFYRFFEPGSVTNGVTATSYGYAATAVGDPAGVFADTGDSLVSGYGCVKHETLLGSSDSFPHLYADIDGLSERQVFQSYYYKSERIEGTGSDSTVRQMKGPRYAYATEYAGSPRITSSFWQPQAFETFGFTNVGYFDPSSAEAATDDNGGSETYKSRWRSGGWNLVESWADFGTVGEPDGFHRIWSNGATITPMTSGGFSTDEMSCRTSSSHLINFVSLFPGFDSFPSTMRFRFKFCEHVVDNTCARVVVGDASTWGACTHRQYMIPTSWSDTLVTAEWRPLGFASSTDTVYGYVVNSAGTVSSATSLVVP